MLHIGSLTIYGVRTHNNIRRSVKNCTFDYSVLYMDWTSDYSSALSPISLWQKLSLLAAI